jgi:hypothetical protein
VSSAQRAMLERMNAANDARECEPADAPVLYLEDGTEKKLPTRWVVCPVCDGKGSHVNPAIDCHGISAEEFAEDPDFAESYAAGEYDQTCNKCQGRTTVRAVDLDALTPEERAAYQRQQRDDADYEAMRRAEIRAGA